jgi:Gas vesicle synthesis protein GvpL/GvpF
MIHLYAFVRDVRFLPDCKGVAGEPLEVRRLDGIEAVVGVIDAAVPQSVECAVAHGLVAQRLLDCSDAVLPARFGPAFADDAALAEATAPRLSELRERLAGVRGCVELTVRVAAPGTGSPAPTDGRAYLRELAVATAARDAFVAAAHSALETRAVDSRLDPPTRAGSPFRAAYLVRRSTVDAFAHEVDRLAARFPDTSFVCTGPWAPSSFAQEAR